MHVVPSSPPLSTLPWISSHLSCIIAKTPEVAQHTWHHSHPCSLLHGYLLTQTIDGPLVACGRHQNPWTASKTCHDQASTFSSPCPLIPLTEYPHQPACPSTGSLGCDALPTAPLGQCEAVSHAAHHLCWLLRLCGSSSPHPPSALFPSYSPDRTEVIGLRDRFPMDLSS